MFETSLQAAFVVPMAAALGFAVLYATLVTLILVPCLYLILLDLHVPYTFIKSKIVRKRKSDGSDNTVSPPPQPSSLID